jgi:phi13 family phage major tail protein
MAKIGLNNFKYSKLDETAETYAGAKTLGKAIDCKVSIEKYEAELYADDTLAESDYTFKKGTVTLTLDEDDDTVFAEILGHTVDEETGEMVRKDTDVAPYVGVGRILTKIVGGQYKYKVEFLPKVKFSEPEQEEATKGDSIEFKTPSVEGTVTKLKDGTWSKSKTFTDKTEAISYLEDLMKSN